MRLHFTFIANFRQRMGREEYWACPSTPCRASSSQSGVQVSSRTSPAPHRDVLLLQCLRLTLTFSPCLPSGCTEGTSAPKEIHTSCVVMLLVPTPSALSSSWAMSMVSNELFIQFNQKALEPSGNCCGEKSHMTVAAISLWRFFWATGAPTGTPKTSCPCARCCGDIHWVVAQCYPVKGQGAICTCWNKGNSI